MDNKGFGIPELFAFALLILLVGFVGYTFVVNYIAIIFTPKSIPNYVNEYRKYYKNGVLVSTSINSSVNSYRNYNDIESMLEEKTRLYVEDLYENLYENDPLYIKVSSLKAHGYIDELNDLDGVNKCSGYTRVEKISNNVIYNSYISCNNYVTNGYMSRFDN